MQGFQATWLDNYAETTGFSIGLGYIEGIILLPPPI